MSPKAKQELVEVLKLLDVQTVVSVEDVGKIIGISRSAAYAAAARGDIPVRRVGRRLFVPVPALRRWLGVDADVSTPTEGSGKAVAS